MKTLRMIAAALWTLPLILCAQPSGVTQIVAGSGIAVSPTSGFGRVTVSTTGGGGAVNSITGTAGQITASAATGNVTLSIPSAMTGINSVATVSGNNSYTITPSGTGTVVVGGTGKITTASGNNTLTLQGTGTGTVQVLGPSVLYVNNSTDATGTTTGGFQTTGGAGIQGKVWSNGLYSTVAANALNVAAGVTPFTELEVDSTATTSPRGIMSAQFNTGTDGARLHFRKARGTRASPTVIVSGDNLGRLVGTGYDGGSYLEDAAIIFGTEGTIASTRIPTNIQFYTATDAAPSVLTRRALIDSAGLLTVDSGNVTAASATNLTLSGGSSGASLVLGQGTNGAANLTTQGTGRFFASGQQFTAVFNTSSSSFSPSVLLTTTDDATQGVKLSYSPGSGFSYLDAVWNNASGALYLRTRAAGTPNNFVFTGNGNLLIGGTTDITGSGGLKVFGTTASTTTTTGSLINAGGFGNAGNLWVGGTGNFAGQVVGGGGINTTLYYHQFAGSFTSTGNPIGLFVNPTLTPGGATSNNYTFAAQGTLNKPTGVGAVAATAWFIQPTIGAGGGGSFTDAATVYINDAPSGGVTNSALIVASGISRFRDTTEATTGGAGSLTTAGGIYVAKAIISGSTTASTSATTGSGIFAGGVGIGGSVNITKRLVTTPSALTYASPTSVDTTLASVFTTTTVNATGSVTFNATDGGVAGQRIVFIITNDATSAKTITFGTNFVANGTLTPSGVNKVATIEFISNGTALYELCRTVLP